jgi:hypothetical protein
VAETITAGLVTLADKVVAKQDGRAKFSGRPEKLIASLVAQKNATARKEARARIGGYVSSLWRRKEENHSR